MNTERHKKLWIPITMLLAIWGGATKLAADEKPNIIYILADDLGYGDLRCYGQRILWTPHLDQMAEQGLRFISTFSRARLTTTSHCGRTSQTRSPTVAISILRNTVTDVWNDWMSFCVAGRCCRIDGVVGSSNRLRSSTRCSVDMRYPSL